MAKAANKANTGFNNPTKKSAIKKQVIKGNSQTSKQSLAGVGAQAEFPGSYRKASLKGKNK